MKKLVVGLIGGMGSGKSLVANELARRGAQLISGDRLGHEALRLPEIKTRVIQRWGPEILDESGEVDRQKLGRIVFADAAERKALETLVFSSIEQGIAGEIALAQQQPGAILVVLDAAVLLEAGWNKFCDRLVFVEAPPAVRQQRLARQRGLNEQEVQAREKAQWPLPQKAQQADFVLDNSGPLENLGPQVDLLLQRLGIGAQK